MPGVVQGTVVSSTSTRVRGPKPGQARQMQAAAAKPASPAPGRRDSGVDRAVLAAQAFTPLLARSRQTYTPVKVAPVGTGYARQSPWAPSPGRASTLRGPQPPQQGAQFASPLSSGAQTFGSTAAAAAWRLPTGRVMPLSKATAGSTFNPF